MLDWIYPQTIETVTSLINGKIKVVKTKGRYSVFVNGFEQSGPIYVEKVWQRGLARITFPPQNILILGLGCGTLIKLISRKWPQAAVTGVEIDPVMLALGKKYFSLSRAKYHLKVFNTDANQYLKILLQDNQKFDLILIDTYIGGRQKKLKIPKKLLTRNGKTITNFLQGFNSKLVIQ